jgi:hypothetical protein
MQGNICRHLRHSRLICMALARHAKQYLSLFASLPPYLYVFGWACKACKLQILGLGMHIYMLFASLPPYLQVFGKACNAIFVAICVTPALFAWLWQGMLCNICRYLRHSRPICRSLARHAMQYLSLFASLPPYLLVFGKACYVIFVAICVTPALFACLWQGMQGNICRYLRHSRPICMALARHAKQYLSLFASLPPYLYVFGWACKAIFVAICVTPALFACLWAGMQGNIRRYLRHSRPILHVFG